MCLVLEFEFLQIFNKCETVDSGFSIGVDWAFKSDVVDDLFLRFHSSSNVECFDFAISMLNNCLTVEYCMF